MSNLHVSQAAIDHAKQILAEMDQEVIARCNAAVAHGTNSKPILRLYHTMSDLHKHAQVYECEGDQARAYMMYKTLCRFFLHIVASHNFFNHRSYVKEKAQYTRLCEQSLQLIERMHQALSKQYQQEFMQARLEPTAEEKQRAALEKERQRLRQEEEDRRAEEEFARDIDRRLKELMVVPAPDDADTSLEDAQQAATAATANISAASVAPASQNDSFAPVAPHSEPVEPSNDGLASKPYSDETLFSASALSDVSAIPPIASASSSSFSSMDALNSNPAPLNSAPSASKATSAELAASIAAASAAVEAIAGVAAPPAASSFIASAPSAYSTPVSAAGPMPPASNPAAFQAAQSFQPQQGFQQQQGFQPQQTFASQTRQVMPPPSAPDFPPSAPTTAAAGSMYPNTSGVAAPTVAAKPAAPPASISAASNGVKLETSLRPIHVPTNILADFYAAAEANTNANIETCGILCGKFDERHELHVTHVIIPNQTATSDTCATTDEEELVELQIKHDLLQNGWIHTHPSQTCFLSSIDMHTHWGYQLMIPEAVAIVLAPRFQPNSGVFHCTLPGMKALMNCSRKGFHKHDEPFPLYSLAPHVIWEKNKKAIFWDLRKKKVPTPMQQQQGGHMHAHSHGHAHPHAHPHPAGQQPMYPQAYPQQQGYPPMQQMYPTGPQAPLPQLPRVNPYPQLR